MLRWPGLAVLLSMLCAPSFAQDASPGAWAPTGCGAAPEKPPLNLSDQAAYNKSVDEVNAYEEKAKAWDTCMMKEANAAMVSVSNDAKAKMAAINESATRIQNGVWAGFNEYSEQFKAAQERFSKAK